MIKKLFAKIFRSSKKTADHEKISNRSQNSTAEVSSKRSILTTKKTAKSSAGNHDKAVVISFKQHKINRSLLSNAAQRTIDGLQKAGF